ncbi:MAG: MFS transporter [Planctomycetaceae bacterium]
MPSSDIDRRVLPEIRVLERPTRVRWLVAVLLSAAAAIAYLDRVIISNVVKELQDEIGISDREAGWVLASFVLGYAMMQIPMGRLGDRVGLRFILPGIVVMWSLLTGLTTVVGSLLVLCLVRFGFGFAQAGVFPLTVPAIRRWFPVQGRGTAQGMVVSSTRLGAILAMLAAPLIVWLGWQQTFLICGGLGLVWAVVFVSYFRDSPVGHPRINRREVALITGETTAETGNSPIGRLSVKTLATNANMWGMSLGQVFGAMGYYLYITWFPTYLREQYGFNLAEAGLLTVLPHLGGWVGSAVGGRLLDWILAITGSLRWSRQGIWLVGKTCCGILFLVAARVENPYMAVGIIALAAFCSDSASPASWAMVTDVGGPHAGVVYGVQNTAGCVGAVICPLLVPEVVRMSGWEAVLPVFAAIFFLSAASWLWVDASRPIIEGDD